jgi:transcription antitermination factor NusG
MKQEEEWYAIQTFINQEETVKKQLGMLKINNIAIPLAEEKIIKNGKEKTRTVKKYPNYVFFATTEISNELWHKIKNIKGVLWFANIDALPEPLTEEEVERLQLYKNK